MFFIFVVSVWSGCHVYLGWRLIWPLRAGPWRTTGWALLGVSALILPGVFFSHILLGGSTWMDRLAWIAYLDMGFVLILVPLLGARDVLAFVVARAQRWWSTQPPAAGRRRFMSHGVSLAVVGLTGGMTGAGYYEARRLARVQEVNIPVAGLPADLEGFRIVQVSDIHLGPTIKADYLRGIVERVNALAPDAIAITGDLVDGRPARMGGELAPLGELRATHGAFFVTGNHEYYWDALGWSDAVAERGVDVLTNQHRVLERGRGRILLAGVTDYGAHRFLEAHRSDPVAARQGAPATDVSILLAHQPRSAFAAARAGYDLQLSGHVHGGQFFPWNLAVGLVQPFTTGLHRYKNLWLYVNAGTGYWGPPVRVGVPSEITLVRLRSDA